MPKNIVFFVLILIASTQLGIAQQADRVQRGQRGYIPPPKYSSSTYIELKDVEEETNRIVEKCIEEFAIDDFQQQILKGMLKKKFEDENAILSDKKNTREVRRKKIIDRNNLFFEELTSIFTVEQINQYKVMDFSETPEDRKEKKKKRKKKKKKTDTK